MIDVEKAVKKDDDDDETSWLVIAVQTMLSPITGCYMGRKQAGLLAKYKKICTAQMDFLKTKAQVMKQIQSNIKATNKNDLGRMGALLREKFNNQKSIRESADKLDLYTTKIKGIQDAKDFVAEAEDTKAEEAVLQHYNRKIQKSGLPTTLRRLNDGTNRIRDTMSALTQMQQLQLLAEDDEEFKEFLAEEAKELYPETEDGFQEWPTEAPQENAPDPKPEPTPQRQPERRVHSIREATPSV